MTPEQRAALPGVAPSRARQILAGSIVAEALLDNLDVGQVEICPLALREGVLLRRLSPLPGRDPLRFLRA